MKGLWLFICLLMLIPLQVNAEVVNANLSQAQLSPEVEYVNGLIKLKDFGQIFANSKYTIPTDFPNTHYFIHNGQLYYNTYPPAPLGLPTVMGWHQLDSSYVVKQASPYTILTSDGTLTIKFNNKTYTTSGVLRYNHTRNSNYVYYWLIQYTNGSLKLISYINSSFKESPVNVDNVIDIVPAPFSGFWLIKSNGELWAINDNVSYNSGFIHPSATCSINFNTNPPTVVPCQKTDISNVVKVVTSGGVVNALLSDGTVMCWGAYDYCGINTSGGSYVPQRVKVNSSTYLTNVVDISGNQNAISAITSDRQLYVWGLKNSGSNSKYNYATLKSPPAPVSKFLYGEEGYTYSLQTWINSTNPVILTLLSNGQVYDPVGGIVIPTSDLPPPLGQLPFGNAKVDIPIGNGKAVTSLSSDLQGNVKFLFSVDGGSTWYKFSSNSFILVSGFDPSQANSYSEVSSIPELKWKDYTRGKNTLTIAVFLTPGSPEPQIASISANVVDLITVSEITCDQVSVYPGQVVNCDAVIQKDEGFSGTLTTTWAILDSTGSSGGEIVESSNAGNTYTAAIRPIGISTPKTIKVTACVGATCVFKTTELIVQSLQPPQVTLTCPTSLYAGQAGSCNVELQLPEGLPSNISPVITWNTNAGVQLTPNGNSASVLPITETNKTITVRVSYNYAPDVFSQQSANIQITPTEITGSLNCPEEAYKGQTITCVLEYQSSREGLSVQWLTPVESVSDDMKTARIKVASNTVSAKVFVQEYPSLYKNFTATLTMRIPPKPIISINSANGTGNSGLVNIPFNIRGAILCPEGLTCSYEWYINDELQQIDSLEFSKTFQQAGVQIITLVAWVDAAEPRELVTSRADYRVLIYDYPRLFMYGIADKKYATVGETITFTAVDSSRESYSDLFPVKVTWLLPDGSTVEGKSATYTVQEEDVDLNNPVKKTIVFSYQYVGVPDSLKSGQVSVVLLPPYRMPDVDIKLYTPAEGPVPHAVVAAPRFSQQFLPGYRYNITYDWELIGTDITGNKKYFYGDITTPGEYTLRLTVGDGLGNVIEKEIPIRATDPLPWNVDFKIYRSNRYNVAPLNLLIKPVLYGGHPRDRVIQYKWTVDGSEISDKTILALRLEDPGTYTVNFTGLTKYGNVVEGETTIEVNPNEPPTCTLSSRTFTGTKTLYVSANCRDPDGIITAYYWSINGGEETKGGSRISLRYDEAGGPITVTLRVVDSGGNNVEVTETFTIP